MRGILLSDQDRVYAAAQLREARAKIGLTQDEVARVLSKPQSFVAKCETFDRQLGLFEALEFCAALGITLEKLLRPELHVLLSERLRTDVQAAGEIEGGQAV